MWIQLLNTQREDSISIKERNLALRVLGCINLDGNKVIEIVSSYENCLFAYSLKGILIQNGAKKVYITYTNGPIEKEINKGYRKYLDARIDFYKKRIAEGFLRITILSPFPMPIAKSDEVSLYQEHVGELSFLSEYLLHAQRCMIVKPNPIWALKLGISLDRLWDICELYYQYESILDSKLNKINSLGLSKLCFKTDEGTDVSFSLVPNSVFTGKVLNENGDKFQANLPCLEVYTAPLKFGVNGKIVFTKPLYYRGNKYANYSITLKGGKIIDNEGLDDILKLDESLSYIGEVALCPYMEGYYFCSLLDENSGCHIALGNAYPYGISDESLINHSNYHIDLVFGSNSLSCHGIDNSGNVIDIFKNGKVVL